LFGLLKDRFNLIGMRFGALFFEARQPGSRDA